MLKVPLPLLFVESFILIATIFSSPFFYQSSAKGLPFQQICQNLSLEIIGNLFYFWLHGLILHLSTAFDSINYILSPDFFSLCLWLLSDQSNSLGVLFSFLASPTHFFFSGFCFSHPRSVGSPQNSKSLFYSISILFSLLILPTLSSSVHEFTNHLDV